MNVKFPVKFAVAVVAVILGIVGVIVCLVPHYSAPEAVVAAHIKALNSGNAKKLIKTTAAEEMADAMGALGSSLGVDSSDLDDLLNEMQNTSDSTSTKDLGLLKQSIVSTPTDAVTFVKAELLGCTAGEMQQVLNMKGHEVTALVKVVYIDAEGEKKTAVSEERVSVVNFGKGFKIIG